MENTGTVDKLRIALIAKEDEDSHWSLTSLDQEQITLRWVNVASEGIGSELGDPAPQLILMTMDAFEEKGVDFCLQIKEAASLKSIPILLMGTSEKPPVMTGGKLLGIDGYVSYTNDTHQLAASIKEIYSNCQRGHARSKSSSNRKISLRGELGTMSLGELLQPIEQTHKSGCLYLQSPAAVQGKLYWKNGEIVAAEAGPYHGTLAFYLMLDWSKGHFRFEEDIELPPEEMAANTISLLMNGFQRLDEYRWVKQTLAEEDDHFFFKLAFLDGSLTKEIMEKVLESRRQKPGPVPLQEFLLQEFAPQYSQEGEITLAQRLEQTVKLAALGRDLFTGETSPNKTRGPMKTLGKTISRHEDAILQRLLLSFSLVSIEQLNHTLQHQISLKFKGTDQSLCDLLVEDGIQDATTLNRLLKLQNEDGGNLFYGYEVQNKLGEGGLGIVYRAIQLSLKREVALKVFAPDLGDSTSVMRFMREAEIASKLDHPNIVKAIDFGHAYGLYYFIMELVKGVALSKHIETHGAFAEKEAVTLLLKVTSAMQHMWKQHILYRDLKPSNIILTDQGVKICDLGLAREVLGKEIGIQEQITSSGILLGTPAYMAPEVFINPQDIDFRADVYSLGVTMYVMMTGQLPFPTKDRTMLLHEQTNTIPLAPNQKNPNLSSEMNDLILKFLSKRPEDRCQNPEDVIESLEILKYDLMQKSKKTQAMASVTAESKPAESKPAESVTAESKPLAEAKAGKTDQPTPATGIVAPTTQLAVPVATAARVKQEQVAPPAPTVAPPAPTVAPPAPTVAPPVPTVAATAVPKQPQPPVPDQRKSLPSGSLAAAPKIAHAPEPKAAVSKPPSGLAKEQPKIPPKATPTPKPKKGMGMVFVGVMVLLLAGVATLFYQDLSKLISGKTTTTTDSNTTNTTDSNTTNTTDSNTTKTPDPLLGLTEDEKAQLLAKDFDALCSLIKDKDIMQRKRAAYSLGMSRNEKALPILVQALADPEPTVRAGVIKGLQLLRNPGAVEHLIKMLTDSSTLVKEQATDALAAFEDAAPRLREILQSKETPEVRGQVAIALGKTKERSFTNNLLEALNDPSPQVRKGAAKGLGILQPPIIYLELIPKLQEPDPVVKKEIGNTLRIIQKLFPKGSDKYKEIEIALKAAKLDE